MRLYSLSYLEFGKESYAWTLQDFSVIGINLIVGKNAVGKSRILKLLHGIARLIDGTFQPFQYLTGKFTVEFIDDQNSDISPQSDATFRPKVVYELEIHQNKVISERLTVNGELKLNRQPNGTTQLTFENVGGKPSLIDIQIPDSHLAVVARRDRMQHKFFEDLHTWAANCLYVEFPNQGQNSVTGIDKNVRIDSSTPTIARTNIHFQLKSGLDQFGHDLKRSVLSDMKVIGYNLTDFGLMPMVGIANAVGGLNTDVPQCVFVKEDGIDKKLPQFEISCGMFRALAILIQLHTVRLTKKRFCLLIDDIGEGLDFERATKLISILIKEADKGFIQLVMSSNDRFIMNNVPLEYWCVLERHGGEVKTFTPRNSEKTFREFEEYGFNNFDFFSKSFFSKGILEL